MRVVSPATHVRPRLARDLSRLGKITVFVWALVTTGIYPRPPYEMALVHATTIAAILGVIAVMASGYLTTAKVRAARADLVGRRLVIERGGKRFALDVDSDVASACGVSNATEIITRAGDVWGFVHDSPAEADAFVEALGFGPRGRRATYDMSLPASIKSRVGTAFLAAFAGAFVGLAIAMVVGSRDIAANNIMSVVLMAVFYELARLRARRPVVTVGVDGVAIAHRFGTRFIPTTTIVGARTGASGDTVIHQRDSKRTDIEGPNMFHQAALAAHVQALARRRAAPPPAALERRGRDVRAWREHLRATVAGGYRVASEPMDAIAAQLSSCSATPEQRIGAALALRVAAGEEGAARVRVAAEQCAHPELCEALEAAAAEEIDDEKLERFLSRLAK